MMRSKFDMQLEELKKELTHMGNLCAEAIGKASEALREGSAQKAREMIAADEEIDQMEKEIERMCLKLLLQQQPVAKDLRKISAALKMITDMERIGDQAADIAEIILSSGMSEGTDMKEISAMATGVSKMVTNSVLAYVNKDLELARNVIDADDVIDAMFDTIKQKLVTFITTGNKGEIAIDLIMVTKYLERIGDHATNIAEWVEFSITGVHADQVVYHHRFSL